VRGAVSQQTTFSADPTGLSELRTIIAERTITGEVVHDSRQVTSGSLYACLRGEHFDGHEFAADAVRAGATAVLVDHHLDALDEVSDGRGVVAQIIVDDTRLRLGPIAAEVAGHPSRALATVGITGTNGKTTTAALMASIFEAAGRPCGVIGTLHGARTTPEAPELQATLSGFVNSAKTAAVLEVSSHALAMHRIDGTEFDAVVFTNLGHDHLDLHGSNEAYFRAKARLFDPSFARLGVINIDDTHGRLLADTVASETPGHEFRVVTYSTADVTDVDVTAAAHRYVWRGRNVEVPMGGDFNVSNSLAALTTAVELGIDPDVAVAGVATLGTVPGRFEVIDTPESRRRGISVVVDYAHTPDGLRRVLEAARAVVASTGSLTVVFGCGGNRDRAKRPVMGAVAALTADRVVVTSDNPRDEAPEQIISEILDGIESASSADVIALVDRRDAIGQAISAAGDGDVVVIAGKGHETTQEFADRVIEFDDRAVAREFLEGTA
jgi:UDP-N-acetylmuramoyl-L-alanyl-D-glutamate--2,6-diaminopimelate ligase